MLALAIVALTSCTPDEPDAVVVDIDIDLTIQNNAGDDMLNPATTNFIETADISVYYEVDGQEKHCSEVMGGNNVILDNPKGFNVLPPDGSTSAIGNKYHLNVYSNATVGEATTIIKIAGHEEIKLVTEVTGKNGNIVVEEIWYKDVQVWTNDSATPKYVPVVLD